MSKFANKWVLITGAGGGFGRETSIAFAEKGANIIAVDLNLETAEQTAGRVRALGSQAQAFAVNVGDKAAMTALAEQVKNAVGAPDVVVNNAGIGFAGGLLETAFEDWERVLDVNLWGVIYGSRLFAQLMVDAGKPGCIVNVASAAAFSPNRTLVAYATSKAAVRMLSDCMRADLADRNIHVACCCPGFSNTGITKTAEFAGTSAEEQEKLRAKAEKLYARRNLKPRAIADAIVNAAEKNKDEVLVGMESIGSQVLGRISPALSRRVARINLTPH